MVWRMFSWHILAPLIPVDRSLDCKAYLSVVVNQVHPSMAAVYPMAEGHFQQGNPTCPKDRVAMNWFHSTTELHTAWSQVTCLQSRDKQAGTGQTHTWRGE